jgi:hypothetical protein
MPRLTNTARDKIAAMIMDHKYKALIEALDKRQRALGLEAYNHHYTPAQRRLMEELIRTSPKRQVFALNNRFQVNVGGWKVVLALKESTPFFKGEDTGSWTQLFSIDDGTALGAKLREYATERKELEASEKKLREQVTAQLRPHYTFERLVAAWPEVKGAYYNENDRRKAQPGCAT